MPREKFLMEMNHPLKTRHGLGASEGNTESALDNLRAVKKPMMMILLGPIWRAWCGCSHDALYWLFQRNSWGICGGFRVLNVLANSVSHS
jgi:hypothetical protein